MGVQIDPVKQPIQRNSVGSGPVFHRKTSAIYDNFHHSLIVFKIVQLSFELREFCACDNVIHIRQFIKFSVTVCFRFGVGVGALDFTACSTSRHLIIDLFLSTVISHCLMGVLHHIPQIESKNTIHSQTSTQRNNFRFCGTVRH